MAITEEKLALPEADISNSVSGKFLSGNGHNGAGNGRGHLKPSIGQALLPAGPGQGEPGGGSLTLEEYGLRGWFRALSIATVLGRLGLYLFLDGYDARAEFNKRFALRRREQAREKGRVALFQEWSRGVDLI